MALSAISSLFVAPRDPQGWVAFRAGRFVSFGELKKDVASLAFAMRSNEGCRLLLLSEDAYALSVGLLAVLVARQTAVLPANLQPGHLAEIGAGLDAALVHDQESPAGLHVFPIFGHGRRNQDTFAEPMDTGRAEVVLHTSGTTGEPLAIRKPLRCLEAEVDALACQFEIPRDAVVQATVPAHHIYGLLFRILWPLLTRRPFAAELIRFPGEFVRALSAVEQTVLVSSPAFLSRALPILGIEGFKDRLGGVFSSGGPLPSEIAAAYNAKLATPIVEVYGSTETGGIGYRSVLDKDKPDRWRPLPGVGLSVSDETGALVVTSSFLSQPGSFQTGDAARIYPDGEFELMGRQDGIVKVEERRVSLSGLEARLSSCEEVSDVRIVPLENTKNRLVLGAVVVPSTVGWLLIERSGKRVLTSALRTALTSFFDTSALPRHWRFVATLPMTTQGKVSLTCLRSLFLGNDSEVRSPVVLGKERATSSAQLRLQLPPDLIYFDGHFDEQPILPGVVQLDWAIRFARDELGLDGVFQRIEALKFFRVLTSGEAVTLELRYEQTRQKLFFRYVSEAHEHSTGRIVFEASS